MAMERSSSLDLESLKEGGGDHWPGERESGDGAGHRRPFAILLALPTPADLWQPLRRPAQEATSSVLL
jgi:hypothetical protein